MNITTTHEHIDLIDTDITKGAQSSFGDFQVSDEHSFRHFRQYVGESIWHVTEGASCVEILDREDMEENPQYIISERWEHLTCTNLDDIGSSECGDSEYDYEGGDIRIFSDADEALRALENSFRFSFNQYNMLIAQGLI